MKISEIFPSKYVKAADLQGRTVTLTIKELCIEKLGHGNEEEHKPVLYFERASKGLVLNRTNAMIIAGLYGDEADAWPGKRISIYPTKVRAFGSMQDCIRVREEVPAQPKAATKVTAVEVRSDLDDEEDFMDVDEDMPTFRLETEEA